MLSRHFIAALVATVISTFAFTSAAETTVGIRAGYNTRSESPVAGLVFQYSFSEHLRLAPNVDYYFRNRRTDALAVNVDLQLPYAVAKGSPVAVYPLVGLNYTSWNYHPDQSLTNDVSTRKNRFGMNAGAGIEWRATSTLKLSAEAKYTLVKSFASGTFTASIAYVF